jgi:hypothetical protein
MDNPEKLATLGTKTKNKAKTQHNMCWKNTNNVNKTSAILCARGIDFTCIRHEPSCVLEVSILPV